MCGENTFLCRPFLSVSGSSPRVRGKRGHALDEVRHARLIPACAGKTRACIWLVRSWSAHPRVCGENYLHFGVCSGGLGSSPRVRGKHPPSPAKAGGLRLIPACAGKTRSPPGRLPGQRAHPRVCGENEYVCDPVVRRLGSSPRVRGKHPGAWRYPVIVGLIPACAGKTLLRDSTHGHYRAHPRVCGENASLEAERSCSRGSSPRVRGKQPAPDS